MAWAPLLSNQWVSRNDLQDGVTTGVFFLNPSQSIPAGNNWITRTEAETWVCCTVISGTANQWPQKSWLIPCSPIPPIGSMNFTGINNATVAPGILIEGFYTNNDPNPPNPKVAYLPAITSGNTDTEVFAWDNSNGSPFDDCGPFNSVTFDLDSVSAGVTVTGVIQYNGTFYGSGFVVGGTTLLVNLIATVYPQNGDTITGTITDSL